LGLGIARWVGAENVHDAEESFDSYTKAVTRCIGRKTAEIRQFRVVVSVFLSRFGMRDALSSEQRVIVHVRGQSGAQERAHH